MHDEVSNPLCKDLGEPVGDTADVMYIQPMHSKSEELQCHPMQDYCVDSCLVQAGSLLQLGMTLRFRVLQGCYLRSI